MQAKVKRSLYEIWPFVKKPTGLCLEDILYAAYVKPGKSEKKNYGHVKTFSIEQCDSGIQFSLSIVVKISTLELMCKKEGGYATSVQDDGKSVLFGLWVVSGQTVTSQGGSALYPSRPLRTPLLIFKWSELDIIFLDNNKRPLSLFENFNLYFVQLLTPVLMWF